MINTLNDRKNITPQVANSMGLVIRHAYIVTKIADIEIDYQDNRIMRLFNPWGDATSEWNGNW